MQLQEVQIFNPIILATSFPHLMPLKETHQILTVIGIKFPFKDGKLLQKLLSS